MQEFEWVFVIGRNMRGLDQTGCLLVVCQECISPNMKLFFSTRLHSMQKQLCDSVAMKCSVANWDLENILALLRPFHSRCSMAASLSPAERFQGEIAMLELISEPRTKSFAVASYWLSVRRDSAPSTFTSELTRHDLLPFNWRPI